MIAKGVAPNKDKVCEVGVCEQPVEAKGLCVSHRSRKRRGGDLTTEIKTYNHYTDSDECAVPNCLKRPYSLKLCKTHYNTHNTYDINLFDYFDLIAAGCDNCGSTESLCLDHDHSFEGTGDHAGRHLCDDCFRGVLCNPCNKALGFAFDDPQTLLGLVGYLEKNGSQRRRNPKGEGEKTS